MRLRDVSHLAVTSVHLRQTRTGFGGADVAGLPAGLLAALGVAGLTGLLAAPGVAGLAGLLAALRVDARVLVTLGLAGLASGLAAQGVALGVAGLALRWELRWAFVGVAPRSVARVEAVGLATPTCLIASIHRGIPALPRLISSGGAREGVRAPVGKRLGRSSSERAPTAAGPEPNVEIELVYGARRPDLGVPHGRVPPYGYPRGVQPSERILVGGDGLPVHLILRAKFSVRVKLAGEVQPPVPGAVAVAQEPFEHSHRLSRLGGITSKPLDEWILPQLLFCLFGDSRSLFVCHRCTSTSGAVATASVHLLRKVAAPRGVALAPPFGFPTPTFPARIGTEACRSLSGRRSLIAHPGFFAELPPSA